MNDDAKKESRAIKVFKGLIPWLVSGGLIAYLALTVDLEGVGVVEAFGDVDAGAFFTVTVLFLVLLLLVETVFLVMGFRWFAGVGTFADLFRARAATYLLTVISVFVGLGGLVVYGKRRYQVTYSRGTAIMLNELLHELASQCTLAMMVGFLLPIHLVPDQAVPAVSGVTVAGMVGVGAYLFILVISRLSRYLPDRMRIGLFDPFVTTPLWRYGLFYLVKLVQNLLYGFFLA